MPDGSSVETDVMRLEEQEEMKVMAYEVVNFYYGDTGFVMTLVLSDEEISLGEWVRNTGWNEWSEITSSFK